MLPFYTIRKNQKTNHILIFRGEYKKVTSRKVLSFVQNCNFNLTDILKLRKCYYDLVFYNRRPHNQKSKNFEEKFLYPSGKYLPQNVAGPFWEQK